MNEPPEGFKALFNGENLEGWQGLVGNPESRAKMSEAELAQKQKKANANMRQHWSVREGVLFFDGKGHSLVTQKKYKDFEMLVDWKIQTGGDSDDIYLRGRYEVQVIYSYGMEPESHLLGGVYGFIDPRVNAAKKAGEW